MKTNTLLRTLGVFALILTACLRAQTPATDDRTTALAEARSGNWVRAESVLAPLAAAEPIDVEICVLLAQRYLGQKRNKEAVELMERVVAAQPDQAGLHSLLGQALSQRIGELAFMQQAFVAPKMLRAFKRSVELDAHHVPGLIGLANYYLYSPAIAGGSLEKAEEYALQVEKLDAFNGALVRAQIRERQEKWSEAAECLRKALAAQPANAWLQARLGGVLAKAGQPAEAKAAFAAALKLQPDQPEALAGLQALAAPKS